MSWQEITPYLVALALGLLIGLEREWSHRAGGRQAAGSRTFALAALAGALAAAFGTWAVVAGLAATAVVVAIGYARTSTVDPGATTEVAVVVTYLLGALALTSPAPAVALAVVVAVLLRSKERLHSFAHEVLTEVEVRDALTFFVVAFVVLPLLPDHPIGPYGVLNPQHIWRIVVLLTGIGLVGYVGVRLLGPRRGLLVTGLAGGFVSASATTATMAALSHRMPTIRPALGGALLASLATLVQLVVVLSFVDPRVAFALAPTALASGSVLTAAVVLHVRGVDLEPAQERAEPPPDQAPARPVALRPALVLAGVLTAALLLARWLTDVLGTGGAVVAAAAAGLADAHAGALAGASLSAQGSISTSTALLAIAASLAANTMVKCGLAFGVGGRRFGWQFTVSLLPAVVLFGLGVGDHRGRPLRRSPRAGWILNAQSGSGYRSAERPAGPALPANVT